MCRKVFYLSAALVAIVCLADAPANSVSQEFEQLKARIAELERKIADQDESQPEESADGVQSLDQLLQQQRDAQPGPADREPSFSGLDLSSFSTQQSAWQSMNPEISVVFDGTFSAGDKLEDIFENIRGFEVGNEFEKGFNLRDVELHLAADVDPYFTAFATFEFDADGAELEEAVIRDTFLPWGLQLQAGKFFSNIGRINVQHAHDWDFVNRPLINRFMFDSNLNDIGVQLSWLLPTDQYAMLGVEVFQGDNDGSFNYIGSGGLPEHSGPRALAGWFKYSPDMPPNHETQLGTFAGYGRHQDDDDSLLDGHSTFIGFDAVYKYRRPGQHYGHGNFTLQGEYIYRWQDLDYVDTADPFFGTTRRDRQDGYYVQGTYGFAPRWRTGLRWDHIGLTNYTRTPAGRDSFGQSYRASAMVDFTPTEFSRFRVQTGTGSYDTHDGRESAWDLFFQLIVSIGPHGAHEF